MRTHTHKCEVRGARKPTHHACYEEVKNDINHLLVIKSCIGILHHGITLSSEPLQPKAVDGRAVYLVLVWTLPVVCWVTRL